MKFWTFQPSGSNCVQNYANKNERSYPTPNSYTQLINYVNLKFMNKARYGISEAKIEQNL